MNTEEERIRSLARERWFLLRLKSKYAGMLNIGMLHVHSLYCNYFVAGQSIAIRLSRRINVVTKQLKSKLEMFNSKHPPAERMTWEGVTRLDADQPHTIPRCSKYQAVRLFYKAARANEEEFRIISEMRNTIKHYLCKLEVISAAIHDIEQNGVATTYQKGARSLLFTRKRQCELDLTRLNSFISHGDFPELSHYLTEDADCEEPELVPEEIDEDPIFSFDSSGLESSNCCQDCPEIHNLDSDELGAMSTSSEFADDEDFLDCSDQEWEDLPAQTAQGPSNPPLLCQSSVKSKTPTLSLNSRQSLRCVDNREPLLVPTDTDTKVLSDCPSSSSDEEELEVQHWRKEKFLCEEYIRSTMVRYHYNTIIIIIIHSPSILMQKPIELDDEQRQMLSKIKEGTGMWTCSS